MFHSHSIHKFSLLFICFLSLVTGNYVEGKCSTLDPETLKTYELLNRGVQLKQQRHYGEAIDLFTQALEYQSNVLTPAILINRGSTYVKQGEFDKALVDIKQALVLQPQNVEGYFTLAQLYWAQKNYHDVIENINVAISLGGNFSGSYYVRGNAYAAIKEYQKGIDDLTVAINMGLRTQEVYYDRAYFYESLGQYKHAENDYSTSLIILPKNSIALIRRAGVFRCLGKLQQAVNDLSQVLEKEPSNVEARLQLAETFYEMKAYREALTTLNDESGKTLDHPYTNLVLANISSALRDLDKALALNNATINSDILDVKTAGLFQRGLFLLKLEMVTESNQAYKKGLIHARTTENFGRIEEAIQILSETEFKEEELNRLKTEILEMLKTVKIPNTVREQIERRKCKKAA